MVPGAHTAVRTVGDDGDVVRRICRVIAPVVFLALTAAAFGSPRPAAAQVDVPLPPVPAVPANPVFDLLAPIASPTCGTALYVALAGPTLVPPTVPQPVPVATLFAPVYAVCLSVPVPPDSTQLVCAADDQVSGALTAALLPVLGSGPPVGTRTVGPIVEVTALAEQAAPAPVNGLGGSAALGGALSCRALRPPPTAAPTTPAAPTTEGDEADSVDDSFGFDLPDADLADPLGLGLDAPGLDADGGVAPPSRGATRALSGEPVGPFDYPLVFLAPLLIAALGAFFTRALTAEVRLSTA